jgi:hypothetical protein
VGVRLLGIVGLVEEACVEFMIVVFCRTF